MRGKWLSVGLCLAFLFAAACSEDEIREIIDNNTPDTIPAALTGLEGCLFDNLARTINLHGVINDMIAGLDDGGLPPGIERVGESNDYEIDLMVDLDDDGTDETTLDGFVSFTDDPEDGNGFAVGEGATINAAFSGPVSGSIFVVFSRTGSDRYNISSGAGSIAGEPGCTFGWTIGNVGLDVTDSDLPQVQTNIPGTGVTLVGEIDIELLIEGAPDVLSRVVFPSASTEVDFRDIRDLDGNPLAEDFSIDLALILGDT